MINRAGQSHHAREGESNTHRTAATEEDSDGENSRQGSTCWERSSASCSAFPLSPPGSNCCVAHLLHAGTECDIRIDQSDYSPTRTSNYNRTKFAHSQRNCVHV